MSQDLLELLIEASNDGRPSSSQEEERRSPEDLSASKTSDDQAAVADGIHVESEPAATTSNAATQKQTDHNKIKSLRAKTTFSTSDAKPHLPYKQPYFQAFSHQHKTKFQFPPSSSPRYGIPRATVLQHRIDDRPTNTATTSATTMDTDDSSTSDDDNAAYPIVFNPNSPIPCIHSSSYTQSYKPSTFISNPYRKTMLSLLCRVRTTPADNFSPTSPTSANDRVQVYACYQHHWNPKFNIPVLTIVAACNTNISQPIITRDVPHRFEAKFMCTTDKDQGTFKFKLPIFSTITHAMDPITTTIGPHFPLPDSLTSYLVRSGESGTVLTWIKIWHLSPTGCYILHNQGIHHPHRPYFEAELHFLGLTGKRQMPYALNQHCHKTTIIQMLDARDLGNVGYKKNVTSKKPLLPAVGTLISGMLPRAFPKASSTPVWYYHDMKTVVRTQHDIYHRFHNFDPVFYPPHYNHNNPIEFPEPEVFTPGEVPFIFPLHLAQTTFEEMVNEALKREPRSDPIATLMTFFNFRREDIPRKTNITFNSFLAKKELNSTVNNGYCVFDSYHDGHNTGERYLVHKGWYPIYRHPYIKEDEMVHLKYKWSD